METIFVTESREMLFTGTEDIDVRPLHSSELHYEGDSREEALRAAHKVSAASRVGVCQRGFARFVATVSEITRDGEGFTEHMDTVHTVDPLDRMPELRTLAREAAANRADGKIIRHIAGHTEAIDAAKRAGDYYSLYRVEGSAFGDFSCYRVGHAPYNGTLYLPAGFHDYGIATVDELFVALVVGRCEFLCEYQDEIDEVYHGLFEKRIYMKGTDMQTIHTKAGFKVLRESLGLYQSDVAEAAGVDVKTVKNWESPRLPRARATAVAWKYLENLAEIQEREVGCLVEKIVDETDGNPYPLPYFREQDLAAEDARAARISNAMTRKVAFELTRLAIPYEFRFEEEAADDERLSEIWDM